MSNHAFIVFGRTLRTELKVCKYHRKSTALHFGNCDWKRHLCSDAGDKDKFGDAYCPLFRPKRVVILSRITRYEFEKLMYKDVTEEQFQAKVRCHFIKYYVSKNASSSYNATFNVPSLLTCQLYLDCGYLPINSPLNIKYCKKNKHTCMFLLIIFCMLDIETVEQIHLISFLFPVVLYLADFYKLALVVIFIPYLKRNHCPKNIFILYMSLYLLIC